MVQLRKLALAAAIAVAAVAPRAGAQEAPAAEPQGIPFKTFVDRALDRVIVPGYLSLSVTLAIRKASLDTLCQRADAAALAAARIDFAFIVTAWSRVEMFRFGPARAGNRQERMFFWPDRRGLGLRQVQDLLAAGDPAAIAVDTLGKKSVAVQGLLALEYLLFGDGSEALAEGKPDTYRCRYAGAVAGALALTAREMATAWDAADGFAATMRNAGPENPVYRSHGEVAQEIIRAAREQLQLVRDLKLKRAIGANTGAAVPTRAPFWRSNQAIPAIRANIAAILALINAGGLGAMLPPESDWIAGSLAFELGRADGALHEAETRGESFEALARDPGAHRMLAYALIPLQGAIDLLEGDLPDALGLTTGFNALDGD